MNLRPPQLDTLHFIAKYTDGAGAWELAEFGWGGASIRSAESRLDRLRESGHIRRVRRPLMSDTYVLTDKGREAIR